MPKVVLTKEHQERTEQLMKALAEAAERSTAAQREFDRLESELIRHIESRHRG